jgi:hypothetical protein
LGLGGLYFYLYIKEKRREKMIWIKFWLISLAVSSGLFFLCYAFYGLAYSVFGHEKNYNGYDATEVMHIVLGVFMAVSLLGAMIMVPMYIGAHGKVSYINEYYGTEYTVENYMSNAEDIRRSLGLASEEDKLRRKE